MAGASVFFEPEERGYWYYRVPYKEFPAQDRLDDDNLTSVRLFAF